MNASSRCMYYVRFNGKNYGPAWLAGLGAVIVAMAGLCFALGFRHGSKSARAPVEDSAAPAATLDGAAYDFASLDPIYKAAKVAERNRDHQAMLALARKVVAKFSASPLAYKLLGDACYYLDNYDDALAAINKAIALKPDDMVAWHDLGDIRMAQYQIPEAEAAFRQEMKYGPGEPLPLADMAAVSILKGDVGAAEKFNQQAEESLKTTPFNNHGGELLEGWMWEATGRNYMDLSLPEKALASFQKAIALDAADADAWSGAGDARLALKAYDDAVDAYDHARKLVPNDGHAWGGLGQAYYNLTQLSEAADAFEHAVKLDADNGTLLVWLGRTYLDLDRTQEAAASYERATAIAPRDADAWYGLGWSYLILERNSDALAAFARSTALDANNVDAWVGTGRAYLNAGQVTEAIAALLTATRTEPGYLAAWMWLGAAYDRGLMPAEAVTAYRRALEISPGDKAAQEALDRDVSAAGAGQ